MSWLEFASFMSLGEPKGQPRPRAFARHGKIRVYDPGSAESFKNSIAVAAMPHRPSSPLSVPVRVEAVFFFKRPKSLEAKKFPDHPFPHIKRPDADNVAKAALDALTTIGMWTDDSLVMSLSATKLWAPKNQPPGAHFRILFWQEEEEGAR